MLRLLTLCAAMGALAAGAPAAAAPAYRHPTAAELEQARSQAAGALREADRLARDPAFRRQAEAARGQATREAAAKAGSSGGPAGGSLPEPDPETVAKARRDLERLLAAPAARVPQGVPGGAPAGPPPPIVLVSFSMPRQSLRALLDEAARIGSPVVLRGLKDGSMRATVEALLSLYDIDPKASGPPEGMEGRTLPGLAIDPTLFRRFGVDAVPAFIVTAEPVGPCGRDGCPVPEHLIVRGEASLAYALDVMARTARDRRLAAVARRWLGRLEGREDPS